MFKILLALLAFAPVFALADTTVDLQIDNKNAQAFLVVDESAPGTALKLYDSLKVKEVTNGTQAEKHFVLSNKRFGFGCAKKLPATSCTFFIIGGANTGDMNTFIFQAPSQGAAIISVTQAFAKEFTGLFPTDSNGMTNFSIQLSDKVVLEARGASWGNMSVGFSSK